jgi:hypothetical protein
VNLNRALQLLLAVVVVGAGVWVARHTYWDTTTVDDPPKGEAASNPFYAFEHLAVKLGVQTQQVASLQALPNPDGVLMVDDLRGAPPHLRIDALEAWVAAGGRLLVSRNLLRSSPQLQSWTGLGLARPAKDEAAAAPAAVRKGPDADCSGYSERIDGSETGRRLSACIGTGRVALSSLRTPAWSLSNGYGFQMLRVAIGKGSVSVIACDCLLDNQGLLRKDHARIVFDAIPLRAGDRVEILNPGTAENLLVLLWRHSAAAIVCGLIVIGLTIWRSLPRFGPIIAAPPPLRRSLAEQIRARAHFAWRTRHFLSLRRAESEALTRAASSRLVRFERMDAAARVDALASHTGLESGALGRALGDGPDGGPEAERAAIALLETARRRLLSQIMEPKVRA